MNHVAYCQACTPRVNLPVLMDTSQTSDAAVKRARRLAELEGQRACAAAQRATHSEAKAQSASQPSLASVHASAATMPVTWKRATASPRGFTSRMHTACNAGLVALHPAAGRYS